jgi:hypothetical protein
VVELNIRVSNETQWPSLQSLYRWLSEDPDLIHTAALSLRPAAPDPGTMGGAFDAITVIVSNAISLGSLIVAYLSWRGSRPSAPAMTIERNEITVNLSDASPETLESIISALMPWEDV